MAGLSPECADAMIDAITAADPDTLFRAAAMCRWVLAHKRDPDPEWQASGEMEAWCLFWRELGQMMTAFMEEVQKIVPEIVEQPSGDYRDEVMDALDKLVSAAFWFGLTNAHVRMGDEVHLPYRLFPGLI